MNSSPPALPTAKSMSEGSPPGGRPPSLPRMPAGVSTSSRTSARFCGDFAEQLLVHRLQRRGVLATTSPAAVNGVALQPASHAASPRVYGGEPALGRGAHLARHLGHDHRRRRRLRRREVVVAARPLGRLALQSAAALRRPQPAGRGSPRRRRSRRQRPRRRAPRRLLHRLRLRARLRRVVLAVLRHRRQDVRIDAERAARAVVAVELPVQIDLAVRALDRRRRRRKRRRRHDAVDSRHVERQQPRRAHDADAIDAAVALDHDLELRPQLVVRVGRVAAQLDVR